jgi:hypothetical protein
VLYSVLKKLSVLTAEAIEGAVVIVLVALVGTGEEELTVSFAAKIAPGT